MVATSRTTTEIQVDTTDTSEKILDIINHLQTVGGELRSLVLELDRNRSRNRGYLELKRMTGECVGQLSEALSAAENLQSRQITLESHLNSRGMAEQVPATTLDVQRETTEFSLLLTSLGESFHDIQDLSGKLQAASLMIRSRLCALMTKVAAAVMTVVALVVGATIGPVLFALTIIGLPLAGIQYNIVGFITGVLNYLDSGDVDWGATLSHVNRSFDTLEDIQSGVEGLKDHASASLSYVDQHEAMVQELQMLREKMRIRRGDN